MGYSLCYKYFLYRIKLLWNFMYAFKLISLGLGFYILKLNNYDDLLCILKEGPRFINGNYLAIRQWEPNFEVSDNSFNSIAV